MTLDPWILDGLLPDLVGHDRRPAAFIVYLFLFRHAARDANWTVRMSHQTIAAATGLSRSTVQSSLTHLHRRQLLQTTRAHPTAVPRHRVQRPWKRLERTRSSP